MEFGHPEKISTADGNITYFVSIGTQHVVGPVRWEKGGLHPDLSIQDAIEALKLQVLEGLVQHRAMFRTPPTLASLRTIAPMWGFLIMEGGKRIEWSSANLWDPDMAKRDALVNLVLKGVQISRQAIRPVWSADVLQILPEHGPMDLDFGEEEDDTASDISSVDSLEIATADSQPFHLRDRGERKRVAKALVRAAQARAAEAQMAADEAIDRFLDEFDLSEGESDFSDDE
jgi:hypothetical protein